MPQGVPVRRRFFLNATFLYLWIPLYKVNKMAFTQKTQCTGVYSRVLACTRLLASRGKNIWDIGKQGLGSRGNFFSNKRKMNTSNNDSDDQTDALGYEILLTTEDDCKPLTGYDISVQQWRMAWRCCLYICCFVPRPHEHQLWAMGHRVAEMDHGQYDSHVQASSDSSGCSSDYEAPQPQNTVAVSSSWVLESNVHRRWSSRVFFTFLKEVSITGLYTPSLVFESYLQT